MPADARGAVLALGNFDGVHRGHQVVIARAGAIGRELQAPYGVVTFEPHPRSLFRPADPPFRLTPLRVKAREVEALGADIMVSLHFDREFASRSAEDFVKGILVEGLGARHLVVGYDFVFGHGRAGNSELLQRMGADLGFGVTVIEPVGDAGEIVSSTKVREHLVAGAPREAAALLGRPWEIDGRVEHGDKRGRTIGFPTANVLLDDYLRPRAGVYAVKAGIEHQHKTEWHDAVANLGMRPTVGGTDLRLEVHLLDFEGDLYGAHMRFQLLEFLRPEQKFAGLDALKAQIALDAEAARRVHAQA